MEAKSPEKRSEKETTQGTDANDMDPRLDDLEPEIIDLVEVVEEGAVSPEAVAAAEEPAADELLEDELEIDDLELEEEGTDEGEALVTEASESEMREADEALDEVEDEFESLLRAEPTEPEGGVEDFIQESGDFVEEKTDKELADLFASDELEVSKLFEDRAAEGEEPRVHVKEDVPAADEEFFEGLFDDLEVEEEGNAAVAGSPEEIPTKEEISGDLLAELGLEPEMRGEAAAPQAPASVEEEIPGDLLAELGLKAEVRGEATAPQAPASVEELPEDLFVDLERPAASEAPELAAVPLQVSAASAEELAALVREQVETVVTRLVEERLPAIAERILIEEIDKIKAAME